MDGVAPKQDCLSLRREFIASVARRVTSQGNELHAVDDCFGAAKRVPLVSLDIRRSNGLRALEEWLCVLRRLRSDFRRQPKVAFCLCDVDRGIRKDTLSVVSRQAADVIGMEVRDQHEVDLFRRIACAAQVARQAPEYSPSIPGAGTRIDEDELLTGVDQETRNSSFQH